MRASAVHNRAGFVVCLHTLNLRKDYGTILVLLYLVSPPHHQYTTLAPKVVYSNHLHTLRLYHVMFCLQSQQYIVQHKNFKNGHT